MNCTIFLHPSMPPFIQLTPIVHYNGYSNPRNDKNIVCLLKGKMDDKQNNCKPSDSNVMLYMKSINIKVM